MSTYPGHNSLGALRLLLAVAVIVSHAWPLGGFGPDPRVGELTLGELAVAGFFGVSGWLITQSRLSSGLGAFAWRRFLRIYPGYLAALVVVAFGFAPAAARLSTGTWSPGDGAGHVVANLALLVTDYRVGASLPADAAHQAWNGSLWTLFSEALCYAAVGLLVTVVGRRATPAVVVGLWVLLTLAQVGGVTGGPVPDLLRLAPFFFAGATLYVLRRAVPQHPLLALAAVVVGLAAAATVPVLAALPVAYLALWLGAVLPLRGVAQRHDLSYGLYIYAFPVQQLLAVLGGTRYGVGAYVVLSVLGTVPFAAASWLLVERPAMRLRHLLPRASESARPGRHRSLPSAPWPPRSSPAPLSAPTWSGSDSAPATPSSRTGH